MSLQVDALRDALRERYRIDEPVGQGAMAVVFRAHDLRHDRPVAVKVLRAELREYIGSERFLREIQVAARLQHPHIVPLFDSGNAGGHVYYVMPFLTDESLRARLDREGPLPVEEAIRLTLQVAQALAYAHRQGVIHRDIKPENILLHEGNALVADFGVAFAVTGASDHRITATGITVGTPAYMSPEQATGSPIDGRSDLYGLACVLYEMLTDELPHSGSSGPELIARKLTEPPRSVRDLRRNLSPAVEDSIERALARLPEQRFASVEDFAAALEGRTRVRSRWLPRVSLKTLITTGLAAVLVTAAWIWFTRPVKTSIPSNPYVVALAPLAVEGDWEGQSALATLLTAEFPGEPGMRLTTLGRSDVAAARREANQLGAGRLLYGHATSEGRSLTVQLEVEDLIRGRTLGQVSATGSPDSLAGLAVELARGVFRLEVSRGDPSVAATLPTSLIALRSMTTGMAEYRAARYQGAAENFQRAIEADSSFALAGVWLALSRNKYGGTPGALDFAWERKDRLGQRDLALLRGLAGDRYPAMPNFVELLAGLEAAAAITDDRPEVWAELGHYLARYGSFLGLPDASVRAEGALLQALRYDPWFPSALERLVEVRGNLGDAQGMEWAANRFLAVDSVGDLAPFVRWRLALAKGDSTRLDSLVATMDNWHGTSLAQLIWTTQLEGLPPHGALAASEALLRRSTTPEERMDKLIFQHDLLANIGRPDEAVARIERMRETDSTWRGWRISALLDALYWNADSPTATEALNWLRQYFGGHSTDSLTQVRQHDAACWVGIWHSFRGSRDTAMMAAGMTAPPATPGEPGCGDVIRTLMMIEMDAPGGRVWLDSLERLARRGRLVPGLSAATSLVLSRLHERVGDRPTARLAARRYRYWGRVMYVSEYLLRSGSLALADGDTAQARINLGRVATLWAAGDSSHRRRSDSLRRVLAP